MENKKERKQASPHYNFLEKNRKAQGMSTTTIILLVLGLIILVVLILGFTMGWQKFAPWLSSQNNIDSLKTTCSVSCATGGTYDFCSLQRDVDDGINDKFSSTCKELSTGQDFVKYDIDECPEITCP